MVRSRLAGVEPRAVGGRLSAWTDWCSEQHHDHPGTVQGFGRNLRSFVPGLNTSQVRHAITKERIRFYEGVALQS